MKKSNISLKLIELRKAKKLSLKSVSKETGISVDVLKAIEASKVTPSWEQVRELATIYGFSDEYLICLQISDEAVKIDMNNIDTPYLVAESSPQYGQLSLFDYEESSLYKPFGLESRRYIGNKTKLTDWIMYVIHTEVPDAKTFCDIFAGTGSVANQALNTYSKVIINDFLISNNIIYKGFFGKGEWDKQKLFDILDYYNSIDPDSISDNWFSTNYGDKYFAMKVAKLIGFIRQDIENKKSELTEKEYCVLLASLIYSIDRLANTVGHFDAYIKKKINYQPLKMRLIQAKSCSNIEIHKEDANQLARTVSADVVYMDPPYNSRQYCRFYHVYETLVKWDEPELFGVALKPAPENMSAYCTSKAYSYFEDMVMSLDAKYLVVSYNNTYNSKSNSSANKIRLSQIKYLLDSCGTTTVYEHKHQAFNAGKTEFEDHKEFLFVTKVDNEKRSKSFSSLLRWR